MDNQGSSAWRPLLVERPVRGNAHVETPLLGYPPVDSIERFTRKAIQVIKSVFGSPSLDTPR